ncbi:MAG: YncE family protein [Sphingomonadaceae bacterium]|nr:YncE family protein [Sphingomonadaceae bacterium]
MHRRHLTLVLGLALCSASAPAKPSYTLAKSVPLGSPDRWDYLTFDQPSGRVYVAHGDRLTVVDGRSGAVVGEVRGIPGGTHGVVISTAVGEGLTDDGGAGQVIAFDLKSLQVTHRIPAAPDADGIALDPDTGHAFVVEGDPGTITVLDTRLNSVVTTIKAGEKMEFPTAGADGVIYVAGEERNDLLKLDARTNRVTAHWPAPDCASPHGLAFDAAHRRLFMGCVNSVMMVMDADSGQVVAKLPIGRGSDAIAYDPKRRRVFSPNGKDGTLTVYQQTGPDSYKALAPISTAVSGRTMAVDPGSGRLFVVAADTSPGATAGDRARPRPGTLRIMIFDPVD